MTLSKQEFEERLEVLTMWDKEVKQLILDLIGEDDGGQVCGCANALRKEMRAVVAQGEEND